MDLEAPVVRPEASGDSAVVGDIIRQAFGRANESELVAAIRQSGKPTVSLVATVGTRPVGHILFSPVEIEAPGPPVAAFGLAPMAVIPQFQRRGIGSRLVEAGLEECGRRGCRAVVVLGHTRFYPRFGFRPARLFGLSSEYPEAGDAFMAMELVEGALVGRAGLVRYLPEFAGF